MSKAYRAKVDVAFPRVVATIERPGESDLLETEGVNYPAGSYILEENLTPRDQGRAESGELEHLVEPVSLEEAQQGSDGSEPEFGVFIAEHEAEAHALEQYGHVVVPRQQEMEALASGSDHAAKYQQAVRDAGYDRRPAQEAMAQERERVPEGILAGAETRTGAPHNPGPQGGAEPVPAEGGEESSAESSDTAAAPRPRPGSQPEGQQG